jgi:hypothetical protein
LVQRFGPAVERKKERKMRQPEEDRRQVLARSLVALPLAGVAEAVFSFKKKTVMCPRLLLSVRVVPSYGCPCMQ